MSPEFEKHAKTETSYICSDKFTWSGQMYEVSEQCSNPSAFFPRCNRDRAVCTSFLVTFVGRPHNPSLDQTPDTDVALRGDVSGGAGQLDRYISVTFRYRWIS
jgi:hypothetical protein